MNPILNITRQAYRGDKFNILTFPTHERYETNLCKTGHNFYAWRQQGIKDWNTNYAPIPDNYHLLDGKLGPEMILPLAFDFILSQNKFGQFQVAYKLSKFLHIPIISLEHTLPVTQWDNNQWMTLAQMKGEVNVFISDYSRNCWKFNEGESEIVHHGIDTDVFAYSEAERRPQILSVVNDWKNRDYFCGFDFWRNATAGLKVVVVGDTPGLSKPAPNVEALVHEYQTAQIFCNTSLVSPIPTSLLEAMSCGAACVSTNNCMIPEVIQHGENGLLCDTPEEMKQALSSLLANPEECRRLGANARKTIVEKFSLPAFVDNWNRIFEYTSQIVFGAEK